MEGGTLVPPSHNNMNIINTKWKLKDKIEWAGFYPTTVYTIKEVHPFDNEILLTDNRLYIHTKNLLSKFVRIGSKGPHTCMWL